MKCSRSRMMEMLSCGKRKSVFAAKKGRRIKDENQLIEIRGRERRRKFGYEV